MKKLLFLFGLISVLLVSCNSFSDSNSPEYYPFKESKSDNWGLVSASGKILVADEFKKEPTCVMNGIFFVQGEDAIEMYKVSDPTKPVGDKFKDISFFTGDYTPSVKKNEGIKYVDKNGDVQFELPLEYKRATNFVYGYSMIESQDGSVGVLDNKFNISNPKKYIIIMVLPDDKFIARGEHDDSDSEYVYYIIDKEGNVQNKLKTGTSVCRLSEKNDMYIYQDDGQYGVKSISGDILIRAKYKDVDFLNNKLVRVRTEDGYGILDLKGEYVIKPKYTYIVGLRDDKFIACRDHSDGFGLLDMSEERIIKYDYEFLFFLPGTNKMIGKKNKDRSIYILSDKGEIISEYSEFKVDGIESFFWQDYHHGNSASYGSSYIKEVCSDYFDVLSLVKSLLSPETGKSIEDMFGYAGKPADEIASQLNMSLGYGDIYHDDGYEWLPKSQTSFFFSHGSYKYRLGFNQIVESYEDFGNSFYYSRTRYRYAANSKCIGLKLYFDLNREAEEHMDVIIEKIDNCMSSCGYSIPEAEKVIGTDEFAAIPYEIRKVFTKNKHQVQIVFNRDEIEVTILPQNKK